MTAHTPDSTPDSILAFVRDMAPDDPAAQLRILAHAYCEAMRDASVGFQRRACAVVRLILCRRRRCRSLNTRRSNST